MSHIPRPARALLPGGRMDRSGAAWRPPPPRLGSWASWLVGPLSMRPQREGGMTIRFHPLSRTQTPDPAPAVAWRVNDLSSPGRRPRDLRSCRRITSLFIHLSIRPGGLNHGINHVGTGHGPAVSGVLTLVPLCGGRYHIAPGSRRGHCSLTGGAGFAPELDHLYFISLPARALLPALRWSLCRRGLSSTALS